MHDAFAASFALIDDLSMYIFSCIWQQCTNICVSVSLSLFLPTNRNVLQHPFFLQSGFGVITSEHVEEAFRRVDRKFFVPTVSHKVSFAPYFFFFVISSYSTSLPYSSGQRCIGSFRPASQRRERAHICTTHLWLCN